MARTKRPRKSADPKTNGRAPKPRQPRLHPSMEPDRIPEIDAASEEFVTCRDARMAYQKTEAEKKEILTALMHKHNQTRYEDADERVVIISAHEELKVEKKKKTNCSIGPGGPARRPIYEADRSTNPGRPAGDALVHRRVAVT